ncbi:MAG: dihydrolipoyl dehydrogenase [Methylococcaceae bacterium]|jgi:dihydrolipoamide dehydrogenase
MSNQVSSYDVVVIGAGPAGYVSAIRCAQLGLKTACVDNRSNHLQEPCIGGTNVHGGSLSLLALLESAKLYHSLIHNYLEHGIAADNIRLDLEKMMQRKANIIQHYQNNLSNIFAHYRIDRFHASARLLGEHQIQLTSVKSGELSYVEAANTIIATGSSPLKLANIPVDNEFVIDYTQALNIVNVPKKLCIIGAGVIGLELAGLWSRLGAETIVLEAQDLFMAKADQQIAREAYRIYSEQGLELHLGARVIAVKKADNMVTVEYQDSEGTHSICVDRVIVASGRKPNTENLATPETNLLLDESGFVHVNNHCRTNLPGVYAIGDLTSPGPMFAHKGMAEGVFVAEQIAGKLDASINYSLIPSIIYTDPEVAWVGQTEQELKAMGEPIKVGVFPLSANFRSQTESCSKGLIKIIAHAERDTILGVHIIGNQASELLSEAILAMEFSASSEDLAKTIHAHPTRSEAVYEAALAISNKAIHLPPILTE